MNAFGSQPSRNKQPKIYKIRMYYCGLSLLGCGNKQVGLAPVKHMGYKNTIRETENNT